MAVPPHDHSCSLHLQLIVTFFLFFAASSTWHCPLPATTMSHSSGCHIITHAAIPPVDCYLFSFYCHHPLCSAPCLPRQCCMALAARPPFTQPYLWLIVTVFIFAASSTLHCMMPAMTMLHGSGCNATKLHELLSLLSPLAVLPALLVLVDYHFLGISGA